MFLYGDHNVRPDIVTGTSVGAINGIKLAEGGADAAARLEKIWTELDENSDMWLEQPWLQKIGAWKFIYTNTIGTMGPFAPLFALLAAPAWMLIAAAGGDQLKTVLGEASEANSIYNLNPIFAKLNDPAKLEGPKLRGRPVARRCRLGERRTAIREEGRYLPAAPVGRPAGAASNPRERNRGRDGLSFDPGGLPADSPRRRDLR
jgi:hypothetical protein